MKRLFLLLCLVLLAPGCRRVEREAAVFDGGVVPKLPCTSIDLQKLFPKSVAEIDQLVHDAERLAREAVTRILERNVLTFDALVAPLDLLGGRLEIVRGVLSALLFAHPDKGMRQAAERGLISVRAAMLDYLFANKAIYGLIREYATRIMGTVDSVTAEQRSYVYEFIKSLELYGLGFPAEKSERVRLLAKELFELEAIYVGNLVGWSGSIAIDSSSFKRGHDTFLSTLPRNDDGSIIVPIDAKGKRLMKRASATPEIYEKMWIAYHNRACDSNRIVLNNFFLLRDQFANLLDFPSYAHLSLRTNMIGTPERAIEFLEKLDERVQVAYERDLARFKKRRGSQAHDHVKSIKPWLVGNVFEKVDKTQSLKGIKNYLPAERVIADTLKLFEKFLGISFEPICIKGLWHDLVQSFAVYDENGTCCGYLLLDLYERPHKYSNALKLNIIPRLCGAPSSGPAVVVVMANFSREYRNRHLLLSVGNVATLFHELGHAIHTFVTKTPFTSFFLSDFKMDFVEIISQLFEEFLCEPYVWEHIGSHYQTGAPLTSTTIAKICESRKQCSAVSLRRRIGLAWLFLNCFLPGQPKDLDDLLRQMYERFLPGIAHDSRVQPLCASTHLISRKYGPSFFIYLFSQVIACDLYTVIERGGGFCDRGMGRLLTEKILRYGKDRDPMTLLTSFLGREPSAEAFFQRRGF